MPDAIYGHFLLAFLRRHAIFWMVTDTRFRQKVLRYTARKNRPSNNNMFTISLLNDLFKTCPGLSLSMMQEPFDYYAWIILPMIIMFCRVADVTLGTMRIILITKGFRRIAPIAGFFEVLIWLFVMTQVIKHMDNIACYFGWATGFATGVYFGAWIDNKIALGIVIIRMIVSENADLLAANLKQGGFSVTLVDGIGSKGPVKVMYTITQRKRQPDAIRIIGDNSPETLYTIEELKSAHRNLFAVTDADRFRKVGKWK